jgi:hypothetical protein
MDFKQNAVVQALDDLIATVRTFTPSDGRAHALVITKLEEAQLWASQVTYFEKAEEGEEETEKSSEDAPF